MLDLTDLLDGAARAGGVAWLDATRDELRGMDSAEAAAKRLPVLFPQLPRRLGRDFLPQGFREAGDIRIDTAAWRACDVAALELLTACGAAEQSGVLLDLFAHGDSEERIMVLRAMQALPITAATGQLMFEVQRTNQVNHVAAGALDSNVLARALDHGDPSASGFGPPEFARLVLKIAFLDLDLWRLFDAPRHATEELSRMLQGLATEREAAGRKVWFGTNELIGHAPIAGTVARLLGGLEHGQDQHRMAAVRGLVALNRPDLRPFLEERLPREERPQIREALERALVTLSAR